VPQLGAAYPVAQTQLPSAWAVPWPEHVVALLYWQLDPLKPGAHALQVAPVKPTAQMQEPSARALPWLLHVVLLP
jgi:hypothetical protein